MILSMCHKCGAPTPNHPAFCDKCNAQRVDQKRESVRYYDRHLRDPRAKQFYRSSAWRKARAAYLASIGYQCEDCLEEYRAGDLSLAEVQVATDVHHEIPLAVNWALRLTWSNFRGLCDRHHKGKRSKS